MGFASWFTHQGIFECHESWISGLAGCLCEEHSNILTRDSIGCSTLRRPLSQWIDFYQYKKAWDSAWKQGREGVGRIFLLAEFSCWGESAIFQEQKVWVLLQKYSCEEEICCEILILSYLMQMIHVGPVSEKHCRCDYVENPCELTSYTPVPNEQPISCKLRLWHHLYIRVVFLNMESLILLFQID